MARSHLCYLRAWWAAGGTGILDLTGRRNGWISGGSIGERRKLARACSANTGRGFAVCRKIYF